jgi:hypothetical protein
MTSSATNRIRTSLFLAALTLIRAPTALASNTWYVDGIYGSDRGSCISPETACKTIGHAISRASSGDSIVVAPVTYTENLTIGINLKLIGSGANTTIIDGGGVNRVVEVSNTAANVTLSGLTIRNGAGGIFNIGTLSLIASTVSENTVSALCPYWAHRCEALGGGIYNSGKLTVSMSTIANNTVQAGFRNNSLSVAIAAGGGIFSHGTMNMSNSTVAGNTAKRIALSLGPVWYYGAGISNVGAATISNSTVSENTYDGVSSNLGFSVTIQNSIVANNSRNCNSTMISNGYNLSNDGSCNFNHTGDLNSHDPLLGPLQNNGGPTETMALLSGSPAIDAGNPSGCTDSQGYLLTTDQRGYRRPDTEDKLGCDMGAYESQSD